MTFNELKNRYAATALTDYDALLELEALLDSERGSITNESQCYWFGLKYSNLAGFLLGQQLAYPAIQFGIFGTILRQKSQELLRKAGEAMRMVTDFQRLAPAPGR